MQKKTLPITAACRVSILSLAALTLNACATSDTPPPVQAGSSALTGLHAYEMASRIIITGTASPSGSGFGDHVDVKLIGADGRVLAEKTERIDPGHPRTSRARHGVDSFAVGFPIEAVREAARVDVSYHSAPHADCVSAQS